MKLRTRLFVWFGGLFLIIVVVSYFLEVFLVHRSITRTSNSLHERIEKENELFRQHFESFLGSVIADIQASVDVLLFRINRYSLVKEDFLPTEKNLKDMTWVPSSELILKDKWIHFLQHTIDGHLTSLINPSPEALFPIQAYKIDDDIAWVTQYEGEESKAYLALHFARSDFTKFPTSYLDLEIQEEPDIYFLFDPQAIRQISTENIEAASKRTFMESEVLIHFQKLMVQKINHAKSYLRKEMPNTNSRYPYEVRKWLGRLSPISKDEVFAKSILDPDQKSPLIIQEFRTSFKRDFNRDHVITMIAVLTTSLMTDLFGNDPLDPKAPEGIAIFPIEKKRGGAIWSRDVFSNKPYYNDAEYVKNSHFNVNKSIPSSIALILDSHKDHLFIGNTLVLKSGTNTGYLTIGMDMNDLIQRLALATNQVTMISSHDRVLGIYDQNGKKILAESLYKVPIQEMQQKKMGIIDVNGEKYYYLHLQPYEEVDFHVYTIQPEAKAFAFVDFLNTSTKEVIDKISFNMRCIGLAALALGLLLLHNISRKMTRRIAQLAVASETVAKGEYDNVELPPVSDKRPDEIDQLSLSFSQMIKGLQDREKVKGVLNKVVSKEIAEEILKGNVKLGGEERNVTILFADIRNFTKLTEKMDPKDVIEMLNGCMTKITQIIDEFHGVIDKYVGDEAMALFGVPIQIENPARSAVEAAYEMQKKLREFNEERKNQGKVEISMGIGVHTGNVLAGNMGAENRLNYTVIGSNVNLAARLCGAAEPNQILISEETWNQVKDHIEADKLEPKHLKGFTDAVSVYQVKQVK